MSKAQQIKLDYYDLLSKYNKAQNQFNTIFSVNVKRRYHPVFWTVKELIQEIANKTNCPVTSIQASHSDGQWRLPHEIMTFDYHPYNQGYGEISHSGYHIIDIAQWLYNSSVDTQKKGDEVQVFSSFLLPRGFFTQLTEKDYINIFGEEYKKECEITNSELWSLSGNYGEMEAFSIIRILKNKNVICNLSINLSHNSFSRRAWLKSNKDLYKGNGRIRHESYNIQQGPFQNLQIHSYQAYDKTDKLPEHNICEVGSDNHFDVYIFRNNGITKDKETLTILRADEIEAHYGSKPSSETAKDNVVQEYLEFICGIKERKHLLSNLDSHEMSVNIMSSLYMSHITQNSALNPIMSFKVE